MKAVDLRSDTVTAPSPPMRKAMADAEVGDDVYGEDPTVSRLEAMVAELTETEARVHDPYGYANVRISREDLGQAWEAKQIVYRREPYRFWFKPVRRDSPRLGRKPESGHRSSWRAALSVPRKQPAGRARGSLGRWFAGREWGPRSQPTRRRLGPHLRTRKECPVRAAVASQPSSVVTVAEPQLRIAERPQSQMGSYPSCLRLC